MRTTGNSDGRKNADKQHNRARAWALLTERAPGARQPPHYNSQSPGRLMDIARNYDRICQRAEGLLHPDATESEVLAALLAIRICNWPPSRTCNSEWTAHTRPRSCMPSAGCTTTRTTAGTTRVAQSPAGMRSRGRTLPQDAAAPGRRRPPRSRLPTPAAGGRHCASPARPDRLRRQPEKHQPDRPSGPSRRDFRYPQRLPAGRIRPPRSQYRRCLIEQNAFVAARHRGWRRAAHGRVPGLDGTGVSVSASVVCFVLCRGAAFARRRLRAPLAHLRYLPVFSLPQRLPAADQTVVKGVRDIAARRP